MKFYEEKNLVLYLDVLYLDDTFEKLKKIPENYVDIIFADPPYFLSNDGISCSGGKKVDKFKV